ncbi:CAP domain-containing protein [Niallia sp. XMNu-256]|uniref:CAP domain-containing protein n=1 Tax=Niallia sp. XMNu-256 TaxID=3082444 RepID=UPI0030D029D6
MIKRNLGVLIAPILVLGLAACNNGNDNAAMDVQNGNGNNTINRNNGDDSYLNRVNYRTNQTGNTGNNNNNRLNVLDREGIFADDHDDNLIDHRGPLTENYRNRKGGNEYNSNSANNRNGSISTAVYTSKSSNNFPHTKAIRTQDARYRYAPADENQENRFNRYRQNQDRYGYRQRRQTEQEPVTQPNQNNQQQTDINQNQVSGNISQYARQVVDLTNDQRRRNGVPDLQIDTRLSNVAQTKSNDMQQNGYFSHTSPTYGSPFDMMRDFGVTYRAAGENIAQGQRTPQDVVNAWMNSEGHRRNILNRNFTHIGVGYEPSGNHWTQMFIGK